MGHNVGKQAALAVEAGKKRGASVVETRTPEEIIKGIRGNLNSPLAILKTDVALLMVALDAEKEFSHKLAEENMALKSQVADLQEKNDRFREVYDMENRMQKVEFSPEAAAQLAEQAVQLGNLPADQA